MVRIAALVLFATGFAVDAVPDVTPKTPRLELAPGCTTLCEGTYTVNPLYVMKQRDGTSRACLRITKRDPIHGVVSADLWLGAGESLRISSPLEPKTRRRIPDKLRELLEGENPIEFDPQAKLISMRQYPDWPIRLCHLVPLAEGSGCMGYFEKRVPASVIEIVLDEKGGRQITLQAASAGFKMPPDEHCSAHGGKIRARLLNEAERNLVKATHQLSEADRNWKSKNPNVRLMAKEAYLELLKEYSTEAVVVNNRERIKARAEADLDD